MAALTSALKKVSFEILMAGDLVGSAEAGGASPTHSADSGGTREMPLESGLSKRRERLESSECGSGMPESIWHPRVERFGCRLPLACEQLWMAVGGLSLPAGISATAWGGACPGFHSSWEFLPGL